MVEKYLVLVFLVHGTFGLPTTNHTCVHDKFNCQDGTCIPINWRCDGEMDCKSEIDEYGCDNKTTCSGGSFQCSSGACVPHRWRCDGEVDCQDGSDEENCVSIVPTSTTQSTMSSASMMMTSSSEISIATTMTSGPSIEGPDPSCKDGQLNCQVLVADIDICSMPASAQLLCASTCHMCSGSSGSQHVTNTQSMQTNHVNPGFPTAAPTSATKATTTEGSTHAPYTAPPTDETAGPGCVDVENNCDHLVKTVNICNDGVKARFLCQKTCNVCDGLQIIG
ncbi:low-density lipoprotein receptor-like isoform X2 [Ostrea edulis]|uniref:low-density lipoprotein receptor-like isoform X2 n=1 Tax=Ostrea edulis TaxID=37623 RepID=UPI0024AEA689|nr:low-density lipoprotein receptor-like isoform X2 [Ostrea edulis]